MTRQCLYAVQLWAPIRPIRIGGWRGFVVGVVSRNSTIRLLSKIERKAVYAMSEYFFLCRSSVWQAFQYNIAIVTCHAANVKKALFHTSYEAHLDDLIFGDSFIPFCFQCWVAFDDFTDFEHRFVKFQFLLIVNPLLAYIITPIWSIMMYLKLVHSVGLYIPYRIALEIWKCNTNLDA